MTEEHKDILNRESPPQDILIAFGAINLVWARLDAIASACLCALLDISAAEFIIVTGQLDTTAKLRRVKKLFSISGDPRITLINEAIGKLERLRPERNALTHGFYIGMTSDEKILINIYTEYSVDTQGVRLIILTKEEINSHVQTIVDISISLLNAFEQEKLKKLLYQPSRPLKNRSKGD